jgi:hypothetical protein
MILTNVSLQAEVSKLQVHRRKYKARFNANVHTIAEKLTDLDERIAGANVLCMSVSEQIGNVATSELRTTMEAMEARISALTANNTVTADKAEASLDTDEVTVSIGELQAMMTGALLLSSHLSSMINDCSMSRNQIFPREGKDRND